MRSPKNPWGATPTTVTGLVLIQKVLPTTDVIAGVVALPGLIADDGGHGCAGLVVCIREEASGRGFQAEGAEVVAGNEFAHHGTRFGFSFIASGDDGAVGVARLDGCQFFELRSILLQ